MARGEFELRVIFFENATLPPVCKWYDDRVAKAASGRSLN